MVEQKNKYFYENERFQQSHAILEYVNCFSSIGLEYQSLFPIKIKTKPCIALLKRREDFVVPQNSLESVANIEHEGEEDAINAQIHSNNQLNDDPIVDDEQIEKELLGNIAEGEGGPDSLDNVDELFEKKDIKIDGNKRSNEITSVQIKLKKPSKHIKLKLKRIIENYYEAKDVTDTTEPDVTNPRKSTKSNIKRLIKEEKIKELVEQVSQLDLNTVCDLETLTIKACLLKILEKYVND